MILVDSSIWIDHLRKGDIALEVLLHSEQVLVHPFVVGEIALGTMRQRNIIVSYMRNLPQASVASDEEVLGFIERYTLSGLGIGYIDAHLLASARLNGSLLWTRDKRLHQAALQLKLAK